jgi:hypothetical protein
VLPKSHRRKGNSDISSFLFFFSFIFYAQSELRRPGNNRGFALCELSSFEIFDFAHHLFDDARTSWKTLRGFSDSPANYSHFAHRFGGYQCSREDHGFTQP